MAKSQTVTSDATAPKTKRGPNIQKKFLILERNGADGVVPVVFKGRASLNIELQKLLSEGFKSVNSIDKLFAPEPDNANEKRFVLWAGGDINQIKQASIRLSKIAH